MMPIYDLLNKVFNKLTGRLKAEVEMVGDNLPKSGQKVLSATAEALGDSERFTELTLIAKKANQGNVYLGGAEVVTSTGAIMEPGSSIKVSFVDLAALFMVADTAGDGVSWIGTVAVK